MPSCEDEMVAACARLPKCPRCVMPSCPWVLEVGEDDEDEFLQCVSCLERWGRDNRRVLKSAWAVANAYTPNAMWSDLYADVEDHVLAEHERARALFEDAGRPLPQWLLKARPAWAAGASRG